MNPTTVLIILCSLLLQAASGAAQTKPNIVFILTDDQGYGDVGKHGHPLLKTPNLDALHDQSVRFEQFYVSPSCSPTRAELLTGMHEFKNGVTHTTDPRVHLNKDAVILPQLLKSAGYRTGIIGKWHLGNAGEYAPSKRGFDWCSTNAGGPNEHFDPMFIMNNKRMKRQGYREDLFFDDAMTFIDESKGTPFFCYLSTYSPHAPLAAPEEFVAPFRGKVDEEEAKFLGMVANLDYNLGRLMAHLRERKLDENTILVFMNDNGETHGLDVYNAGMRGSKCTIWQGGYRAMSFWKWAGKWQPHEVQNLTAHLDVLPTLCDLAGVTLNVGHLIRLGFNGPSEFTLHGSKGLVTAERMSLGPNGVLNFVLDSDGAGLIKLRDTLMRHPGAKVEIDGTLYRGGARVIPLVVNGSNLNDGRRFTPQQVRFEGFAGLMPRPGITPRGS